MGVRKQVQPYDVLVVDDLAPRDGLRKQGGDLALLTGGEMTPHVGYGETLAASTELMIDSRWGYSNTEGAGEIPGPFFWTGAAECYPASAFAIAAARTASFSA
jgi:hypothetical protein